MADVAVLVFGGVVLALNIHIVTDAGREWLRQYYRRILFVELRPVALANCTFARFGHAHDGGYLMCTNLLQDVRSVYSYGIEGRDEWGCMLGKQLGVPVHQYDCFVTTRPRCPGAEFDFHEECVGERRIDEQDRVFGTLQEQIVRNGDREKRLAVKIDIEGAEWQVLRDTPEDALARIDQLVVEFHETDQWYFVGVLRRLRRLFVVAHVHFNNVACHEAVDPFPSRAYEVLFVNKRLAQTDTAGMVPVLPTPLDSPNNPNLPDCQGMWR
jgi:hypothetical protein